LEKDNLHGLQRGRKRGEKNVFLIGLEEIEEIEKIVFY
jgi:hypothetical protein